MSAKAGHTNNSARPLLSSSTMDSEDDVPLSNLSSSSAAPAAVAAKRKPEEQKGDDGDDFQAEAPPAKKVKKEKKEKKEKKHKKHKKHKKEKKHKKSSSSSSSSSSSKRKAAAADPSGFKTGKVKEMKIPQLLDRAMKAHRWWMEPPLAEGQCWETLEHCGIKFAAPYEPHNVKLLYEGKPIDLTAVQEELATLYAVMPVDGPQLGTKEVAKIFNKNFFEDFKAVLGKGHAIKKLALCDFGNIRLHLAAESEKRKGRSKEEKAETKADNDETNAKYGCCGDVVDAVDAVGAVGVGDAGAWGCGGWWGVCVWGGHWEMKYGEREKRDLCVWVGWENLGELSPPRQ